MTKTERYIKDAIKEAAKDFKQTNVTGCSVMNENTINIGDAAKDIARALQMQAGANQANSEAIQMLATKLDMVEITGMRF